MLNQPNTIMYRRPTKPTEKSNSQVKSPTVPFELVEGVLLEAALNLCRSERGSTFRLCCMREVVDGLLLTLSNAEATVEQLNERLVSAMLSREPPPCHHDQYAYVHDDYASNGATVRASVATHLGHRRTQEDRVVCHPHLELLLPLADELQPVHYAAVFDGYNSDLAADFCRVHMHVLFARQLKLGLSVPKALENAFERADQLCALWTAAAGQQHSGSGCTGLVAVITGGLLYHANVGEVSALYREANVGQVSDLYRDAVAHVTVTLGTLHDCSNADEIARLQAGGFPLVNLRPNSPKPVWRVVDDFSGSMRYMTRAIGDVGFSGLISRPHLGRVPLNAHSDYLVIASDGLWDSSSAARVCSILDSVWRRDDMDRASQRLISSVTPHDNAAVCVLFFKRPRDPQLEIMQWLLVCLRRKNALPKELVLAVCEYLRTR